MSPMIDKKGVAMSFSKAAKHYDQYAQLQRDIGDVLLNKLNADKMNIDTVTQLVDLGCGTGYFAEKLNQQFPHAAITCFDLSQAMLEQAKKRPIKSANFEQGDVDALPFENNSLDVIYSNLVVQWSNDLKQCLRKIYSSLKPGGRCYISTLVTGTLAELTLAWKTVDQDPHTNSFLSLQNIEGIVADIPLGYANISTETRTLYYGNVIEVMRALKGIGANHVHGHQSAKVAGRQIMKQLQLGYLPFMDEQGRLKLTYQVCYIEIIK
jgi:malonyl-CoA O-methyltransferase